MSPCPSVKSDEIRQNHSGQTGSSDKAPILKFSHIFCHVISCSLHSWVVFSHLVFLLFFSWPKPIDTSELGLTHPLCLYLHRFSYGLCTIKSKPPFHAAWNTGDIAPNSHTSSTCFPGWGVRDGTEWENYTK